MQRVIACVLLAALSGGSALAEEVRITQELPYFVTEIDGQTVRIDRIQEQSHRLSSDFTKTSRPCPPFCIHPMKVADGVETVGELELMEFIDTEVTGKTGLLVDARVPVWYQKGTIPTAINVPFTLFDTESPFLPEILTALGARRNGDGWDFSAAKSLALFCNGLWCDQSPRAISNLLEIGYPAEKLLYYRGGMQAWQSVGLTVIVPQRPEAVAASARETVGGE